MREHYRRPQHQHVVVVGGASQERAGVLYVVTGPQPQPVTEEGCGGVEVGSADDHVAELARHDAARAQDPGGAGPGSLCPAGAVVGRRVGHGLFQPWRDAEYHLDARGLVAGGQRPGSRVDGRVDPLPVQPGRCPGQVVGVVHADLQLEQAPGGCGDELELAAAVLGGEPALTLVGEPDSR